MPARTNEFQTLMLRIYRQLSPTSAKITESAMLMGREIDILIETDLAGHTMRMGIECRDRKKKDDIQWIDQIIGKYSDLPVHQVVAISHSGFSDAAKAKAKAHHIDIRTIEEVTTTNWKNELEKLALQLIDKTTSIDYQVYLEPKLSKGQKTPKDCALMDQNGKIVGTLEGSIKRHVSKAIDKFYNQLKAEILAQPEKTFPGAGFSEPNNPRFIEIGGNTYQIVSISYSTVTTVKIIELKTYRYNNSYISIGEDDKNGYYFVTDATEKKNNNATD